MRFPSGLSVKSGSVSASNPASSPRQHTSNTGTLVVAALARPDSNADAAAASAAAAAAAATVSGTLAVNGLQQSPEQMHTSTSSAKAGAEADAEAAANLAVAIAAGSADQALGRPQPHDRGMPGFGAMSPAQQSAAILTKWGVAPPPELQSQLLQQLQVPHTSQRQLSVKSGITVTVPGEASDNTDPRSRHASAVTGIGQTSNDQSLSHISAACTALTSHVQAADQVASANPGRSANGPSLSSVHTDDPQPDLHDSSSQASCHPTGSDSAAILEANHSDVGSNQSRQQLQEGADGARLVSEQAGADEGGLTLEQPDGEGSATWVPPEVVRGRVVRATEMWHRQRMQQEASQQVPPMLCKL